MYRRQGGEVARGYQMERATMIGSEVQETREIYEVHERRVTEIMARYKTYEGRIKAYEGLMNAYEGQMNQVSKKREMDFICDVNRPYVYESYG